MLEMIEKDDIILAIFAFNAITIYLVDFTIYANIAALVGLVYYYMNLKDSKVRALEEISTLALKGVVGDSRTQPINKVPFITKDEGSSEKVPTKPVHNIVPNSKGEGTVEPSKSVNKPELENHKQLDVTKKVNLSQRLRESTKKWLEDNSLVKYTKQALTESKQ